MRAQYQPATLNKEERSVDVVLSTDKVVEVFDYARWNLIDEVLLADGAEFPDKLPLLDNHVRRSSLSVIGSLRDVRREDSKIVAKAVFARSEQAQEVFELVQDGHLTDVSIGYRVIESSIAEPGEVVVVKGQQYEAKKSRALRVATKYAIMEGSTTPIGANNEAKIRSIEEVLLMDEDEKEKQEQQNRSAPTQTETVTIPETVDSPPASEDGAIREALRKEQERAASIIKICRQHGFEPEGYISRGLSVMQVKSDILDQIATRRNVEISLAPQVGADQVDKTRAFLDNCLALRMDMDLPHEKTEASYLSLVDMAREFFVSHNVPGVRRMSKAEIAKMCFSTRAGVYSHATGDFPYILQNALNKRLQKSYLETPSTYQLWCYETDVPDFKEVKVNQLSEGAELSLIAPGEPYPEETYKEAQEVYTLDTYGKVFCITWQALVNDDLRAFNKIAKRQGYMAKFLVNKLAYTVLTANEAMGDAVVLFHATHSNLGAAALSSTSLGAGRAAMRIQPALDGNAILNLIAKWLIVPAALEQLADQLANSTAEVADNRGHVKNPHLGKYGVVVEGLLDGDSTTKWYLACDQNQWDTVEVAFLEGYRQPVLEQEEGFLIDGRKYKVKHNAVAKAIDYRGLYMSTS